MLSIGDLRNRIIALADESARGNPAIYELFSYRFPVDVPQDALAQRLGSMVKGADPLVEAIPSPMRRLVRTYLRIFAEKRPDDFDLRGASLGNIMLAGGYLENEGDIDSVVYLFSKLVAARGTVLPIVNANLHLKVALEDGAEVVGQHLFSGKQGPQIVSPVRELSLVADLEKGAPAHVAITPKVQSLIQTSDLVVYPIGSFYSSVLCNLLPTGVGRAIAGAGCPKVYVPSMGEDPETRGTSVGTLAARIVEYGRKDAGDVPTSSLLNMVLVDRANGHYPHGLELDRIERLGIQVVDADLADAGGLIDPERLARVLLSMA